MPAISSATALPRRGLAMPWLLLGGYAAAALDLLAAMAYWVPRGIAPGRIPQSIAAWLLGPEAFAGGVSTAVFGALLYGQLLWGVTMLYHAIARRHPLLLRRPLACGALYGILAYVAIFQLVAPLCFGARPVHDLVWTATCVLVYATLVGMPCALFSRAALTTTRPA